jgi:hypothetical protein
MARHGERPARAQELQQQRDHGRRGDERDQPGAGVAQPQVGRIIAAPEAVAGGVVEQRGELEVEIRPYAEHEPHHGSRGERNHEPGSVHEKSPATV